MRLRWWPILAPAVLSLALSAWIRLSDVPNPVLFLRAELSVLVVITGIALTLVAGIGLLLFDYTDRIRVQSELEAAAERRRFLRRLDHELKNPITAILAGLINLSAAKDPADRNTALESVQVQVERMRKLVADLRKLSDLEAVPLEREEVDVAELLEDAFQAVKNSPEAGGKDLSLSIPRAPWPLPQITGDYDLLSLAVYNLLDNATKFTEPGGRVEVRAFEESSHVTIEVADTGPGIPEHEVPHVWEELYRGVGARGISGSGLGLALVRAVSERHNGRVGLRSRSGEGTVFSLRLPIEGPGRR